jgi:hypothetical protein
MRLVTVLIGLAALIAADRGQDHHAADPRGARVMGFDQRATTHHFFLFGDGGAIDVGVNDPADAANLGAIRSHLPHIAAMFGAGNFAAPMLVHDSTNVPGTAVMAKRKDAIRYKYLETATGGRVDIVTTDGEALAAVHAFLRFQIADHKSGDTTVVRPR